MGEARRNNFKYLFLAAGVCLNMVSLLHGERYKGKKNI